MADHAAPILQALRNACVPLASNDTLPALAQMAAADVDHAPDLLGAFRAAGTLILSLEEAAASATENAKRIRQALLDAMIEAGAAGVQTDHHTIGWAQGAPAVVITGEVPARFMRTPPAIPDKAEIKAALKEGLTVPGATLGNAAPYLQIRARKA
ncbi:siphovirus Gp157 family protein [Roseomonas haemaphysalidis]|uniref:Siphovirus Gp157 family protein n=1 Tax=Roseomonas haemaphysalidis TaxID=2768162 RepID=A0ABS3KTR1_9PROT|nr:siphovirus Gp157 family protein [Roseomonas haemaphysalidis]MBO1080865.1 siphovirus Gp157 family protein [Roseomonas haemaphysalidis]